MRSAQSEVEVFSLREEEILLGRARVPATGATGARGQMTGGSMTTGFPARLVGRRICETRCGYVNGTTRWRRALTSTYSTRKENACSGLRTPWKLLNINSTCNARCRTSPNLADSNRGVGHLA